MTRLFVGLDKQQNRVVIRCLTDEWAKRWGVRKSFFRSAEVINHLNHPNVIKLIETGYEGRVPFMVIEFIESRTLRDLILYRDPLLTDNVLSLMRQLAEALLYIHNNGFLHLDVKPENILIRNDGHLVLIDFDLAIPTKRWRKRIRQLPGTPSYIAPETLTTRMVNEKSDVYSFGVTCYEMLTYHKPFEGDKIEQVRAAQIDPAIPPTKLRSHNPAIPVAVENLILKCLAKNPADRYPSMSLVIRDLEALI
ncbi:MAG: Serine/threonine-protein kinase PknL [Verrucomicrobia bacterium ADurb.Bin345]|nr:MAG: Serine/threonine-protein kinase PknL [Verrucomicrobia bacterium ADurb.Bin345]